MSSAKHAGATQCTEGCSQDSLLNVEESTRHRSPQEQEAEAMITQVHQNWTTADRQALCGEMKGLIHPDSMVQPGEVKVWFGCTLWAP